MRTLEPSTIPPDHRDPNSSERQQPKILIIGAGMSGILLVIKLREAGFENLTVYEKGTEPGGTWRDNTYPGLQCDIPSHMFTYSFEPNPEYSRRFPAGHEIRSYLNRVYSKHDVGRSVQFQKVVQSCTWTDQRWKVTTNDGQQDSFDFVISATGILHTPYTPDFVGKDRFQGLSFHTARWNHDVTYRDKRVGVIGTGATSAQIIPELVKMQADVTLFQRTPQWIFPMPNKVYQPEEIDRLRKSPSLAKRLRYRYSKIFQWTFTRAVIGNSWLLWGIEAMCKSHLKRKVKDDGLRARLTPKSRAGCKRLIFGKGFYQALQKPNAKLVTEGIEEIQANGVLTKDGTIHPLDILIYATGFQAHNYMRPIVVQGKNGKSLDDAWSEGAYAHRSTSVPGFPNFFMIFGPYSPIGNYSAISVAEAQTGYIIKQIDALNKQGKQIIEAKEGVTRALWDKMKSGLKKTIWYSGCNSWYMDKHGNIPMWPWTFERFEKELGSLRLDEFNMSERTSRQGTESKQGVRDKATVPSASAKPGISKLSATHLADSDSRESHSNSIQASNSELRVSE